MIVKPVKDEIVTATDVLRKALKSRNTAILAKELQVASETLNSFMLGKSSLPPTVMQALTTYLFGGAVEFDPTIDRLRSANKTEPVSQGSGPPRYQPPPNQPTYAVGTLNTTGPQPVNADKPITKVSRPGWVE